MDKAYEAKQWEGPLYQKWEEAGFFNPDTLPEPRRGSWSCVLPPPNATGVLHAGHVVMAAYQDAMARYQRLRGKRVLWLPGTDHAAIATQTTVEKKLLKEQGKTRHQLGRVAFLAAVDEFVKNSQSTIRAQLRATGASLDWSREAFTLDAPRQRAVRVAFKKLYEDGLIYRGLRVINWCPRCQSTLSDDEVEYEDKGDFLTTIQYGPVQVATTRPETKLGDTGLAVHPDDGRYKKLVGQILKVKLADHEVSVKVVADPEVDPSFGTGVIGITPAHSKIDERMAQRHNLPSIQVIGEDGRMNAAAGKYKGLLTVDCATNFCEDLRAAGQLVSRVEHIHPVSKCYRCDHTIEQLPKEQWFVAVGQQPKAGGTTLRERVIGAVEEKKITIVPERFAKSYLAWAENLHDWCISRQIWYGHRIPAYYFDDGETLVTDRVPTAVLWARHGETKMTVGKVIQGAGEKTNAPLSITGVAEAKALAEHLAHESIDVIVTSPLERAKQTASIVAKMLGKPVAEELLLIERNYGVIEGVTMDQAGRLFPDYATHRRTAEIPEAETPKALAQRTKKLFAKLAKTYPGQRVLCITHNGLLRAALHLLTGREMESTADRIPLAEVPAHCRTILLQPSKMGSWNIRQDEDTLDTWFSSALWTFSTLGWPEKTKDLKTFHPTQWMETGYDILNAWVSKMVMMSGYFLNQVPFKNVYLHGIVRDEQGRKMSKSLSNGIDPLEVIPRYGADALRLALTANTTPGNDMKLSEEKIAGFRNFANKLWNIGRFVLQTNPEAKPTYAALKPKTPAETWILQRLHATIATVTEDFEKFEFSHAIESLHRFTWDELADWYLEVAKLQPNPELLRYLLTQTLIVWHPLCPFVTEAIWANFAKLNKPKEMLMVQRWPKCRSQKPEARMDFDKVKDLITDIRSQRATANVEAGKTIGVTVSTDKKTSKLVKDHAAIIERLARCALKIETTGIAAPKLTYELPANEAQVAKERQNLQQYITSLEAKLNDASFIAKAPAKVVEEQRKKLEEARKKLELLAK